MRKNEYNSLDEFCAEYDGFYSSEIIEKHRGLEFIYHNVYYRLCREPLNPDKLPQLPDGRKAVYDVNIVHWKNGFGGPFEYELIGWYADLQDMLDECILQGKMFRDVIMADETEIVGKD